MSDRHLDFDGADAEYVKRLSDDFQIVEEALAPFPRDEYDVALAALARLREREAEKDEAIGNYMKQSSEQADESRKWRFRAEAAEAEVSRLTHIMECADTPLMRDVMMARDAAEARVARLEEALREIEVGRNQAQRDRARRALDAKEGE